MTWSYRWEPEVADSGSRIGLLIADVEEPTQILMTLIASSDKIVKRSRERGFSWCYVCDGSVYKETVKIERTRAFLGLFPVGKTEIIYRSRCPDCGFTGARLSAESVKNLNPEVL